MRKGDRVYHLTTRYLGIVEQIGRAPDRTGQIYVHWTGFLDFKDWYPRSWLAAVHAGNE